MYILDGSFVSYNDDKSKLILNYLYIYDESKYFKNTSIFNFAINGIKSTIVSFISGLVCDLYFNILLHI